VSEFERSRPDTDVAATPFTSPRELPGIPVHLGEDSRTLWPGRAIGSATMQQEDQPAYVMDLRSRGSTACGPDMPASGTPIEYVRNQPA
jgi:hypothetical protein